MKVSFFTLLFTGSLSGDQDTNEQGKTVRYLFNYSAKPGKMTYPFANGRELLKGGTITKNMVLDLAPWGVKIIEEQ